MIFHCNRLRLTFRALDPLYFPPGRSGNAFRGALGHILRRREPLAYAWLFEPDALTGPSGFADVPRPFVIRTFSLEGKNYSPGECFSLDLHLFDVRQGLITQLEHAFEQLERQGIGPERARIQLLQVSCEPIAIPLQAGAAEGPREFTVRFLSPTELKSGGHVLRDAPFQVVLARARDRIALLSALYGEGPLPFDFRALAQRAAQVAIVRSALEWFRFTRRSSRTHQVHPLEGFAGEVQYRGSVGEFLPILRAAAYTGIGRHAVWGLGAIEIAS